MCRRLWTLLAKRNVRIIKESILWRRWIFCVLSYFVARCNQLELTSRIFCPEHNLCPLARIKCGTEAIQFWFRTRPSRQLVSNGFATGVSMRWIHCWHQTCQSCLRECPGESYIIGSAYSVRNHVKELPYAEKKFLQLPMDFREGSVVSLSPMTRIC